MERPTLGHYLAHEAGRLAGVDGDRIGQWARWGHIRASVSTGDPHVYAFTDVADALAVHLLLEAGLSLPLIRRAVEVLGGLPSGLHVVGGSVALEGEDVFTRQRVFPDGAGIDPVALLRRGGWPTLVTGVEVDVDPTRAGGRPCVKGTRCPVQDALDDPDIARWWACGG